MAARAWVAAGKNGSVNIALVVETDGLRGMGAGVGWRGWSAFLLFLAWGFQNGEPSFSFADSFYARRIAGGDCNHWGAGGAVIAGGASGEGGGEEDAVFQ